MAKKSEHDLDNADLDSAPGDAGAASASDDGDTASAHTGTANDDVACLPYEAARDELASIVARLESGQVGLEESMTLWERGEALAKRCETWLDAAEAKLRSDTTD